MRSILFTIVSIIGFLLSPYAGNIETEDGRIFIEATIKSVTPSTVTILHDHGISKVPLSAMPKEFRDEHGYDPSKDAAYKKIEEENRKADAQILSNRLQEQERQDRIRKILADFDTQSKFVKVEIRQVVEDGVLGDAYCEEEYTEKVTTRSEGLLGPGLAKTHNVTKTKTTLVGENIFISGITNAADGEAWSGKIWPAGTYSYTDLRNARRTVRRWSTSRDEAIMIIQSQK
jgi:hypothetical protein